MPPPQTGNRALVRTQNRAQGLKGIKENSWQIVVRDALILGQAIKNATGGIGVKEGKRCTHHIFCHGCVHPCRRPAPINMVAGRSMSITKEEYSYLQVQTQFLESIGSI